MAFYRCLWLVVFTLSISALCSATVNAANFFDSRGKSFVRIDAGPILISVMDKSVDRFLWRTSGSGVFRFYGYDYKIKDYLNAKGRQLSKEYVGSIKTGKEGVVWADILARNLLGIEGITQQYRLLQFDPTSDISLERNQGGDILTAGGKGDGSDSELQLTAAVLPAWHQTWVFRFLMLILFLFSLYVFYLWSLGGYRQQIAELDGQVKDRTDELAESVRDLICSQSKLVLCGKQASLGRLVTDVAHEINTPLGVAKMAFLEVQENTLELMQEFDSDQIEDVQIIARHKRIERSSAVLEQIFDRLSKLVDGFMLLSVDEPDWQRGSFSVDEWLDDVPTQLVSELSDCNVQLEFIVAEDLQVFSCPTLLKHVVLELIRNALQHGFSEAGPSDNRICVRANIKGDAFTPELVLRVEDNGCGIPEDLLPTIFDPFTAAKSSSLGLGLHVVVNLLRNVLQAEISCANIPSLGCCFTVTVPLKKVAMTWLGSDLES